MKLDRLSIAAAAVAVALACGCSSTTAPTSPQTAMREAREARELVVGTEAGVRGDHARSSSVTGTTSLMSARLPGPAPRVGKSHRAVDSERESESDTDTASVSLESDAPKEARRSDGSRRGGGFGSAK
jgi:hypothetical protein